MAILSVIELVVVMILKVTNKGILLRNIQFFYALFDDLLFDFKNKTVPLQRA